MQYAMDYRLKNGYSISGSTGGFAPPLPDNVLQWLDGTKDGLGYYDGSTYLSIAKTQTLTSDWQCMFKTKDFIPTAPDNFERLYTIGTSEEGRLYYEPSGNITWVGNNGTQYVGFGTIDLNKPNEIELEMKIGGIRLTFNGSTTTNTSVTWVENSWTSWVVGNATSGSISALMGYFSDCDEEWNLPDLTGSKGTVAVKTDPSGTFNKFQYLRDLSILGTNYGLYDTVSDLYNIDPTGALETALGLTPGTLNAWLTRAELDALYDALIKFTTPIPENSTLPADKFRSVIYELLTILTQDQKDKIVNYVGRGIIATFEGEEITFEGEKVTYRG